MSFKGMLAGLALFAGSIFGNPTGYDYEYIKAVNSQKLEQEIAFSDVITAKIKFIKTVDDRVKLNFDSKLSPAEETSLQSIVLAHDPTVTTSKLGLITRITNLENSVSLLGGGVTAIQVDMADIQGWRASATTDIFASQGNILALQTELASQSILIGTNADAINALESGRITADANIALNAQSTANNESDIIALEQQVATLPIDLNLRTDLDSLALQVAGIEVAVNDMIVGPKEYAITEMVIGTTSITTTSTSSLVGMRDMSIAIMAQSSVTVDIGFLATLSSDAEPLISDGSDLIFNAPKAYVRLVRYSMVNVSTESVVLTSTYTMVVPATSPSTGTVIIPANSTFTVVNTSWEIADATVVDEDEIQLNKNMPNDAIIFYQETLPIGVWSYAVYWRTESGIIKQNARIHGNRMMKVRVQKIVE